MNDIFKMPFEEYMAYRTKFAIDRAQRDNIITIDHTAMDLMRAMWAREYWFKKVEELC
jgi:hypothetical protein